MNKKTDKEQPHKENFVAPLSEMIGLIKSVIDEDGEFRLVTAGTSMKPLLRSRVDTVILIKPRAPLKKYDIPLYRRETGQFVLHRIVGIKNGKYLMCGDNQTVVEKGVREREIIAVVSKIIRNGKEIDISHSFLYKLYVFFWCRCFPLRYVCLKAAAVLRKLRGKTK